MTFDYIIIGAGLSGLTVATKLASENAKVLLIEALDHLEGSLRTVDSPAGPISNGLRLIPTQDFPRSSQDFLSSLLTLSSGAAGSDSVDSTALSCTAVEKSILTYGPASSGSVGFRPFVGFGEKAPAFIEQISSLISGKYLTCNPPPAEWSSLFAGSIEKLFIQSSSMVQTKSTATKLEFEGNKIRTVIVNGQRKFHGDQIIYCGPMSQLKNLIPPNYWPGKSLARYAKINFWTLVGLDLVHSAPIGNAENLYLLDSTAPDEFGPCLGSFSSTLVPADSKREINVSQWVTFLEDERAEDSELLGQSLKKVRRQIKRAFPDSSENFLFERICVLPSWGAEIPTQNFLPEIDNLHFANGQLSGYGGPCGSLNQSYKLLKSLGFISESFSQEPQNLGEPPSEDQNDHPPSEMDAAPP